MGPWGESAGGGGGGGWRQEEEEKGRRSALRSLSEDQAQCMEEMEKQNRLPCSGERKPHSGSVCCLLSLWLHLRQNFKK